MDSIQKIFKNTSKHFSAKIVIAQKINNQWMQLTFGDLGSKVNALAGFLQEQRIRKGDRVGIILENCWEWVVVFFAIAHQGAVAVPISPEASSAEINNIIADASPALVFISEHLDTAKINALTIISAQGELFKHVLGVRDKELEIVESAPDDPACILYTSGTTANPKGVMLSQNNLLSNCNSINKLNLIKSNDSIISILPLHHAFALTITLLMPVLSGLTIVYPQTLRGDELLEAMQETKPTIFLAVPKIFYLMHQKIMGKFNKTPWFLKITIQLILSLSCFVRRISGVNLARILLFKMHRRFGSRMRLFVSGGARLDPAVAADLYRLGFTILEGYGLTETAPVLTLNPYARPKFGSVGRPLPDVKIEIYNQNTQGMGEVIAQGPNIMLGYYKMPDKSKEVIKEGWFYTGDLGFIDKQGYLYLTGRQKEVIVLSSGLNIFPQEIEDIYAQQSPVKEICVFDAPTHNKKNDAALLWVMVVPDLDYFKSIGEVNLERVLKDKFDNASRALPEYKRIRGFSISLESLPRTLLGKIKRFEVKNAYIEKLKQTQSKAGVFQEAELSSEYIRLLATQTGKKITAYLKQYAKTKKPILPGDLLELDLGLDSLGRVELASGLEKVFNIKIDDAIIGNAFTVGDLIQGIDSLIVNDADISSGEESSVHVLEQAWGKRLKSLPAQENIEKIDLRPGIGAWLVGTVFIEIVKAVLFIFFRLKISGKHNVPKNGPYIVFANHTSFLDGFIMGAGLPAYARMDIFFLGFRSYFNVPIVRNLIKIGRIIPLDFSTHLLESLRSSYYILSKKKNLCVFPEGVRSLDGRINFFKKGFGILAKESAAKLVPVYIKGAYEAWPRTSKNPKLHPLHIRFGSVMDVEQIEKQGFALGAKDSYEAVCLGAQQAINNLTQNDM